jgi:hypothetical protein
MQQQHSSNGWAVRFYQNLPLAQPPPAVQCA